MKNFFIINLSLIFSVFIIADEVDSSDSSAVGYKLIFPRFTISYPGDTLYSEALLERLSGSDILILPLAKLEREEGEKVLDVFSVQELVQKLSPKLAILTGFGTDVIREGPIDIVREIQRATGVQCIAAKEGLVLTPEGLTKRSPVSGYQ